MPTYIDILNKKIEIEKVRHKVGRLKNCKAVDLDRITGKFWRSLDSYVRLKTKGYFLMNARQLLYSLFVKGKVAWMILAIIQELHCFQLWGKCTVAFWLNE